jgi:hypothetical protein
VSLIDETVVSGGRSAFRTCVPQAACAKLEQALLVGNFDVAVEQAFAAKDHALALLVASAAGPETFVPAVVRYLEEVGATCWVAPTCT